MWPNYDEALAFDLIWGIPLLLIPLTWWVIARTWGKLIASRRWVIVAALLCPIAISITQLMTDWSLTGYLACLIVDPVAIASYACLVFLLWISLRRWLFRVICVLLLLPAVAIVIANFILPLGMFAFPHASGRLTPTLVWRTDWTSMSFTSDWVEYSLYTNPRWFPLIKHKVINARCDTSAIVEGNPSFRTSPDGQRVIISCRQEDGTVADKVIQIH